MNSAIYKVLEHLCSLPGLSNVVLLGEKDKQHIRSLELPNNEGVFSCLSRTYCLAMTHDESFRPALGSLVTISGGVPILPPLPFPELNAKDAISSSPNRVVHKFLVSHFSMKVTSNEATLLVGFNL